MNVDSKLIFERYICIKEHVEDFISFKLTPENYDSLMKLTLAGLFQVDKAVSSVMLATPKQIFKIKLANKEEIYIIFNIDLSYGFYIEKLHTLSIVGNIESYKMNPGAGIKDVSAEQFENITKHTPEYFIQTAKTEIDSNTVLQYIGQAAADLL